MGYCLRTRGISVCVGILLTILCAAPGRAATFNWGGASGNWNDSTQWIENNGFFPDAPDDVANVTADISAATTVTLTAPIALGTLNLGDPADPKFGYTIAGSAANTLTFSVTGDGNATITKTGATSANDTISAPIIRASNLDFINTSIAPTNFVTFSGNISGSGTFTALGTGPIGITGVISGSGGITHSGTGTLFMNSPAPGNIYTGDTILNSGSFTSLSGAVSDHFGTGTLILNGGTVYSGTGPKTIANAITVMDETTSVVRGGNLAARTMELTGPISGTGTLSTGTSAFLPAAGVAATVSAKNTTFIRGDISGFEGTFAHETILETANASHRMIFDGATANSMDGSKAKFALSGETTGVTLPFSFGSTTAGVTTFKMGELAGPGGIIDTVASTVTNQLEIGHLNSNSSFAGVINGATLNVTKVGSGRLTLAGANTYAGTTTVSGGKLLVDGSLATAAATTVESGATLGGSGQLSNTSITIQSGGAIAPGAGGDTLTFTVLNVDLDGMLKIEFGDDLIDKLAVAGSLDLTNAAFDFTGLGDMSGTIEYEFVTYDSLAGTVNLETLAANVPMGMELHHDVSGFRFYLTGSYSASLPGDHNGDGFVNAADYVVWRDTMSGDIDGYNIWKANFGITAGAGSGQTAAVPEPASFTLLLSIVLGALSGLLRHSIRFAV